MPFIHRHKLQSRSRRFTPSADDRHSGGPSARKRKAIPKVQLSAIPMIDVLNGKAPQNEPRYAKPTPATAGNRPTGRRNPTDTHTKVSPTAASRRPPYRSRWIAYPAQPSTITDNTNPPSTRLADSGRYRLTDHRRSSDAACLGNETSQPEEADRPGSDEDVRDHHHGSEHRAPPRRTKILLASFDDLEVDLTVGILPNRSRREANISGLAGPRACSVAMLD